MKREGAKGELSSPKTASDLHLVGALNIDLLANRLKMFEVFFNSMGRIHFLVAGHLPQLVNQICTERSLGAVSDRERHRGRGIGDGKAYQYTLDPWPIPQISHRFDRFPSCLRRQDSL